MHVQLGAGEGAPEHVPLDCFTIIHWRHPLFMDHQLDEGHHALSPRAWHPLTAHSVICPGLIPWVPLRHHLQGQPLQYYATRYMPLWVPCCVWNLCQYLKEQMHNCTSILAHSQNSIREQAREGQNLCAH